MLILARIIRADLNIGDHIRGEYDAHLEKIGPALTT